MTQPDLQLKAQSARAPRIISLSMVKNEQDIIEPFIRHHARLVDCMVIVDNGSVDQTRRIALECARELGNVVLADSGEFAYKQAERMTRMLHGCQSAFFADFVLFLDTDEFLSAMDRPALQASLDSIPAGGVGLMPWRTFVLKPGEDGVQDPPRQMRWRRSVETPPWLKAVLRLDGEYRPNLQLAEGNHNVAAAADRPLPSVRLEALPLLHFPVRSRWQLVAKGIIGWMAALAKSKTARRDGVIRQWRDVFDRAMTTVGAYQGDDLCEASLRYAQERPTIDWDHDVVEEAPPAAYERRYSSGAFADPLRLVAKSWERSLLPAPGIALPRPRAARGTKSGATSFDADWHWDNLYVDLAPFRYIGEKYRPAAVLDVGCGIGAYLSLFKGLGAGAVFGVDGVPPEATLLRAKEYEQRDLGKPLDLGRQFDLAVCVEVVEHLERPDAERLLDDLAWHASSLVVFSAASPGQPGNGHINCQPIEYWLDQWAARGWVPHLTDSLGIRSLSTLSWLRRNLLVLQRGDPVAGAVASDALREIARRPYQWYGQQAGIRISAFSEPLPAPPAGYAAAGQ